LTVPEWTLIAFPVFVVVCMIRQWKGLAPLSAFANLAILFTVGIVIYYALSHCILPHTLSWSQVNHFDVKTLPVFFGISIYTFEGIGLVIDMEKSMAHPNKFERVMWIAFAMLVVLFIGMGAVGYLAFGSDTQSIIILNLPSTWIFKTIAVCLMIASLFITYPVQMFPVFNILENAFFTTNTIHLEWKRSILRMGLVIITIGVALGVPHFGLFLSLVGSLGCSTLAFLIPILFYHKYFKQTSLIVKIVNTFIFVFGLCPSVITLTTTIIQIVQLY